MYDDEANSVEQHFECLHPDTGYCPLSKGREHAEDWVRRGIFFTSIDACVCLLRAPIWRRRASLPCGRTHSTTSFSLATWRSKEVGWSISTLVAYMLAFWMGFSANRAGACLVAAAYEVQVQRRPRMLIGLLVASAGAGLVAIPLDWSGIAGGRLADSTDITTIIVVGGGSFGVGALINDACLLGSLNRLGGGEIRLIAMPFGLFTGLLLIDQSKVIRGASWPSVLSEPNKLGGAALIGFLIVAVLSLIYICRRTNSRCARDRPLGVWMLALGTTGGALYAIAPDWNYVDLARRGFSLTMAMPDASVILMFAASIAGAVTAALREGSWRLQRPTLTDIARSLIGGAFMGVGVALIPGGNSGLVLAAIPALSPGGIVAYLMMMVAIFLGLSIRAWISHSETAT